jgi:hypothetical protein
VGCVPSAHVSPGYTPSGVVTFLFTDAEGSTRRWEADADGMRAALATHDEVLHPRSRRMVGSCSSTPVTECAPRSDRRGARSMRVPAICGSP